MIEIRKNHDTSDIATQVLQGVMMWSRHAQAGQDRLVERVGGEGKGQIRALPWLSFMRFPQHSLQSDKVVQLLQDVYGMEQTC